MSSLTAAANLPKITALRQQLGYGDVGTKRYNTSIDDVRAFRRKFRTREGQDGISFSTWNSSEHQSGLNEMATAYVETNGCLFWPDNPLGTDDDKLQFSRDKAKIKNLMKQLFFRLNEQEVRNNKYKDKIQSIPSATQLSPAPIDLDIYKAGSTSPTQRRELKRNRSHIEEEDILGEVSYSPFYDNTKVGRQAKRSKRKDGISDIEAAKALTTLHQDAEPQADAIRDNDVSVSLPHLVIMPKNLDKT
ncbi:hypothetical protein F5Y16DRAFT_406507 [Xylariaceae sp. FL0255]|nr:hypothetical protein F5Y16DRAFT_406507 [Xylariaceae sp. FL0255]